MKKKISTDKAPSAIGPYSQAIIAAGTIYVSGQLPIDPSTGSIAGDDIKAQTRQSLENIRAVLESAGAGMENVVKTTVFLKDIGEFTEMNEVYAQYFTDDCPARAAFQVGSLPKNARVEIEAIAVL
ncbi:RidA family protein [Clostridium sp. E02]|uniref:RidA family protein n=1 Tax=Clostridium sp. E02 TaxID=2487134 RepID=UPI0019CFFBF2|nr:RidA family protein [Clostridium sp. E02]